jgi:hypothetical protein
MRRRLNEIAPPGQLGRWASRSAMATKNRKWTEKIVLVLVTPFLFAWVVLWLVFWGLSLPFQLLYEWWLKYQFRQRHGRFGRIVLFIYSDSPNWKDYVETNILPRLEPHVVTLNWSQRQDWQRRKPFEARLFQHWAGETEFNPMALVFAPTGSVRDVRFWQAFRDFKHGKDRSLKQAEQLLFSEVERIVSRAA